MDELFLHIKIQSEMAILEKTLLKLTYILTSIRKFSYFQGIFMGFFYQVLLHFTYSTRIMKIKYSQNVVMPRKSA